MGQVVSLFLSRWPTDRLRRKSLGSVPAADTPLVLVGPSGNRRSVVALDALAQQAGLHVGMPAAKAQALVPGLAVLEADPQGDADALDRLAVWALRFSPVVAADPPDGLVIEVTGTDHLHGGEEELLRGLVDRFASSGLGAQAAVADTWGAAHAAARYAGAAMAIVAPGEAEPALAHLPLASLQLDDALLMDLRVLGMETVGDAADQPRAPLTLRFGPQLARRLDQAFGMLPEPIDPVRSPDLVEVRRVFAEPIGAPDGRDRPDRAASFGPKARPPSRSARRSRPGSDRAMPADKAVSSGGGTSGMAYPDVVVVLPGLIGSVLAKDGKPIWGTSPGALWDIVAGNALRELELAAPDDGSDDLGDGIVPTGLIANPEIVPGLWRQGGYTRLGRDLVDSLQLVEGRNYFEFAYDWRRDNRVSARRLARDAHGWLKEWRADSGNDDARIVLIAHSMGGLVARHYIECLEGWRSVRMLVSFGTPYRGSGNALDFLSNGFRWKVGSVGLFDGTRALRSFASVHQLLPTYPFVEGGDGTMSRVTDLDLPNISAGAARSAAAFHVEIADAVAGRPFDPGGRSHGPLVRPVVGTEQPTWQSAKVVSGKVVMSRLHQALDPKGDGTVSRVSAIPIEGSETHATYVAATHSSLQSVDEALAHLRGVLTGTGIDLDRFRRKAGTAGSIELWIDDMYASDEPVTLSAVPSSYVQTLDAVVEPFETGLGMKRTTLMPVDGRYSGSVRLPVGLHRVTVRGRGMRPVTDIFLVQDLAAAR